jgi:dihydrofolate reductase
MVSLDGYAAGPAGDIRWHNVDEEFNSYAAGFLSQIDTLLLGRITYNLMARYWPTAEARREDPLIARRMNEMQKVVVSRTLRRVEWENSTLIGAHVVREILRLKRRRPAGKRPGYIAIFGSSNLALTLIRHNLIDEYRLIVNPVILGRGTPLFAGIGRRLTLRLQRARRFRSGNVLLTYLPHYQS